STTASLEFQAHWVLGKSSSVAVAGRFGGGFSVSPGFSRVGGLVPGCADVRPDNVCATPDDSLFRGYPGALAIVEPALLPQEHRGLLVAERHRRQPRAERLADPDVGRPARRETIAIAGDLQVAGRRPRERVGSDKAQHGRFSLEQLPGEMDRPRVLARAAHRGEPEQPVQPIVVWAHPAG